jgi:hypothetical protein
MLVELLVLAVCSSDRESSCAVCYHTIAHFALLEVKYKVDRLTDADARESCSGFSDQDDHSCRSLISANFSAILDLRSEGLSPFDICIELDHCPRPAAQTPKEKAAVKVKKQAKKQQQKAEPVAGHAFHPARKGPGFLGKLLRYLTSAIDVNHTKETGSKLVADGLKASQKFYAQSCEVVDEVADSKEWKTLKKDARSAFMDFYRACTRSNPEDGTD